MSGDFARPALELALAALLGENACAWPPAAASALVRAVATHLSRAVPVRVSLSAAGLPLVRAAANNDTAVCNFIPPAASAISLTGAFLQGAACRVSLLCMCDVHLHGFLVSYL